MGDSDLSSFSHKDADIECNIGEVVSLKNNCSVPFFMADYGPTHDTLFPLMLVADRIMLNIERDEENGFNYYIQSSAVTAKEREPMFSVSYRVENEKRNKRFQSLLEKEGYWILIILTRECLSVGLEKDTGKLLYIQVAPRSKFPTGEESNQISVH